MTENIKIQDLGAWCWENAIDPWSELIQGKLTTQEFNIVINQYRACWYREQ
jgi:hypothetical protein